MNLQKLFEAQQVLDEHIMNEHPELRENESNLDWKLLALQVELGECANEWRGFKKWSKDQEPRTSVSIGICIYCSGSGDSSFDDDEADYEECDWCNGEGETNKLIYRCEEERHNLIISMISDVVVDVVGVYSLGEVAI